MTVSLLEKARARRIEALASLTNKTTTTSRANELFNFDLEYQVQPQKTVKPQRPVIKFVSRRYDAQEHRLAA